MSLQTLSLEKTATKIVASFGAAMGAMYYAPSLDADVVDLTDNLPGTMTSTQQAVNFIASAAFDWLQYNDATGRSVTAAGYLNGLLQTSVGNELTGGAAFAANISLSASFSGTETFGFRTINNQLGWIQVRYGAGSSSPIEYLAAAFEDIPGNSITVGDRGFSTVPEPNSLGLAALAGLAVGASTIRRKRKSANSNSVS